MSDNTGLTLCHLKNKNVQLTIKPENKIMHFMIRWKKSYQDGASFLVMM